MVIKPEFSRFGVHVRRYPEGMPPVVRPFEVPGKWVVQAFCRGRELCSYSVLDRGRLLAHACYRPAYRIGASSSYVFEPYRAERVRAFVEAFAQKTAFTGQLSFDWIEAADGTCQVLECNPRSVSGVHLFGLHDRLPAALMGESIGCVEPAPDQLRMIGPVMLAAALWPPLRGNPLRAWWRDYTRAADVIARPGDVLPLFGGLVDLGATALSAFRHACSLRQAATQDIEWDGGPMGSV